MTGAAPMIRKNTVDLTQDDIDTLAELHCVVDGRPLVTEKDLPTLDDYFSEEGAGWLEGKVPDSRYAELVEGADPTEEEFRLYLAVWLKSLTDGNYDSDRISTCAVSSYEDEKGNPRYAVICSSGYSFSEVRHRLYKADFTSLEAAAEYLDKLTDTNRMLS